MSPAKSPVTKIGATGLNFTVFRPYKYNFKFVIGKSSENKNK